MFCAGANAGFAAVGPTARGFEKCLSAPPKLNLTNLIDMATKPRWCLSMLKTRHRTLGKIIGHVDDLDDMSTLGEWISQPFDPRLSWDNVAWIKERFGGPLIIKGTGC